MTQLVKVEIRDHVAFVRLNRPEKYNALSLDMFEAIIEAGEAVRADTSIRSVVLSGEGRGFCAGLDFESFMKMGSGDRKPLDLLSRTEDNPANYAQRTGYVWKQVPVPVIAALHGVSYGGGLQIALGADIRLASADARFSIMEIKWGLIPDMSATQTLKDLVRLDVAKELTFTGRIVEAEEALRLGLITQICENPLAEAERMAREIAGKSPDAIAAGKQLWEKTGSLDVEEGLKLEESLQRTLIGGHNQLEAVKANFEKRPPVFKQRS
jgi:enoyl-CoA hydratase/carnithine racemase